MNDLFCAPLLFSRTFAMPNAETFSIARLYKRVRDALDELIVPGGVVLSFGWNSAGMGKTRGYEMIEILLVAHGGAHNDTICVAERKVTHGGASG